VNKAEVSNLLKKIKYRFPSFHIPTNDVDQSRELVNEWLVDLKDVSYETAYGNLINYSSNPDNRFAPHPGVLAQNNVDDVSKYHEILKAYGADTVLSIDEMREKAMPISDEQRRKVREIFGK